MVTSSSLRARSIRGGAAMAVAAVATLAGAGASYAAPGDSGDIDVRSIGWHARGGDGVEVCEFVLSASNFESFPAVAWTITAQPPTTPPGDTLQSTLPLVNGSARSAKYLLPEGTYQLVWTTPAGPKQKRFSVDCKTRPQAQHSGPAEIGAGGSPAKEYSKPVGGVPAGGGAVPEGKENLSSGSDTNFGTTAALAASGVGIAALVMVRRAARRRARNEA
ncbi:hypothetical protein ACFWA4_06360 [Streptomyces sp. NPDC060011]|uniref:hypothetical protein n=1 Tax=unclassified Streptomyces TaxID=2593676 RepID=UPI0013BCF2BB|nr:MULTISPECIES: hypothetical protein [unclassified Streptomyces]MCX4919434.1 hypothetical protein [Streptomyces sp. NBC_00687]MCX5134439.1 hypothetical protein [Streptomyces sp. NBC_00340]MCX5281415.1 hypothetical protein [Streptomyces sp. NBC_00198]NEB35095.1 hypothetical protein [Streptomyces sp. SID14446]WSD75417.1 hypothetical protein OHB33_03390 [Streptomyces sp. NBC_01558]